MNLRPYAKLTVNKSLALLFLAGPLAMPPALRATLPATTSSNLTVVYPSTAGAVATTQSGSTLTITSTAPVTVLNWADFWDNQGLGGSSASGDQITYTLPGATSSILNNVSATAGATTINGAISSNGKVYILNPNGITISPTGSINVAGFYASTIPENLSYFEQNGTLQVFTSTPPAASTTGAIEVKTGSGAPILPTAVIATIGGSGDIRLAANGVDVRGGGSITGNLYIVDTGAATPTAVNLSGVTVQSTTVGGATVGGNLSISSNGGAVNLSDLSGFTTNVTGNLAITSDGGSVNLAGAGDETISGGSAVVATGTVVNGTTSVNTVGTTVNGTVSTTGSETFSSAGLTIVTGTGSAATTDASITLPNLILGTNAVSVTGGTVSITDTTDPTLTVGTSTVSGNLTLSAVGSIATQNFGSTSATPATVTVTKNTATISLTADSGLSGSGKSISFNGSGAENFATLAAASTGTDTATITTTGNITLSTAGAIEIPTLSLTTTSGTITQTTGGAAGAIGASGATPALTVNAPTVTLANTSNDFASVVLLGGSGTGGISLTDATGTLTIGNKTSTTGNVAITNIGDDATADNIDLGASSTNALSFGGNLSLTLTNQGAFNTTVATNANTVTVSGNTTIKSNGTGATVPNNDITLGGAPTSSTAWNFTGPISITITGTEGGNIAIGANSAVVLGATSTTGTGALSVTSALTGTANSGISDPTGAVTIPGTTTLAAGTAASPSNIQIGTTTAPASLTGNIEADTANNLTLVNKVATNLVAGTNTIGGQTSITQTGAGTLSAVTSGAATSNLSIADTGSAPAGNVSVTIPSGGGGVTLSNFAVGGTGVTVGVTTTNGAITLGSGIADSNTGATTLTAAGAAGSISDTASSPVSIYGSVTFDSSGAINVSNNTGSNLGGVSLILSGGSNNSNITYTEGGGVNLQDIDVSANSNYSGTVAITSVNSLILETTASTLTLPPTAKLTLTASSANGAVVLNNPTGTSVNEIGSPVSITATGNSSIWNGKALILNGVNISTGTFTASTGPSALGAGAISEAAGTTVYSYANDSFVTDGSTITLGNSGNNFGGISIDTTNAGEVGAGAGANATIKEFGGDNYVSVNTGTGGNFSATSEQSIILETGNTGASVGGTTTLAAPNGSITFNATGNNFSGHALTVTTTGNASVTDSNLTTLVGDGTNVTGNLTVSNINAAGTIKDNGTTGNITVGGIGAFLVATSGGGDINFTGANNSIASIELKAGTGTTTFFDNTSLAIVPGTVISGPANLSSGGSITASQSGPVTFASTLSLNANGNITFSDTSALFNGKVTAVVTGASSDVNFSALSLATNFNNVAPSVTTSNNATYYQAPGP